MSETKTESPKSRQIDPDIAMLRAEHNEKVAQLRRKKASAGILKTIVTKRLAQLLPTDRESLLDTLMLNTTRCFPSMLKRPEVPAEDEACQCCEPKAERAPTPPAA